VRRHAWCGRSREERKLARRCRAAVACLALLGGLVGGATVLPTATAGATEAPPSRAGVWREVSTVDHCGSGGVGTCLPSSAGDPPKRTFRLSGPCDGVGPCLVELLDGWTREWTASACAAPPEHTIRDGLLNRLAVSFPPAGTDTITLEVVSVVSVSPPSGFNYTLTAEQLTEGDSDSDACVPPAAPTAVTVVAGDGEATVSWTASAAGESPPVTEYVAVASNGSRCTTPDSTSCTITGLRNGDPLWFWVVAWSGHASATSTRSTVHTPSRCGGTVPVYFFDVGGTHPFCADIEYLSTHGLTTGFGDGTFRGSAVLTRQALAAILFRYHRITPDFPFPGSPTYGDIPAGHPFARAIEWLATTPCGGRFSGPSFEPQRVVRRDELAACLVPDPIDDGFEPPAEPTFTDVVVGTPSFVAVEWLAAHEVTKGYADGGYHPAAPATRQVLAAFLHRQDLSYLPQPDGPGCVVPCEP